MVNGERYRVVPTEFLFSKINQLNIKGICFQQTQSIDLLQNQFGARVMLLSGFLLIAI